MREKAKFWELLTNIGLGSKGPWLAMGDFNEVIEKVEKWGGKDFNPNKARYCINLTEK